MFDSLLNNKYSILYFYPFLLGCLSVLSFQPFNFTIVNFFILPLFFYIIIFIKKKSKSTYRIKPFKKNLFIAGSSFGFGFYLSGIHWIINSLTFDDSFKILIPIGLILIPLFLSLFFSLVLVIVGPFLKINFISIILFSGALAFSDYLRSNLLTGFPWNLWAYSFSSSTEIIQILNKLGLFTFNLLSITIFMLPALLFIKSNLTNKLLLLILISLILFSSYIYGNYSINKNKTYLDTFSEKQHVKVVSPNFDIKYNLNETEIENRLKKLIRYSEPNENKKTLFIWPEGVFSGYSYNEVLIFKDLINENFS